MESPDRELLRQIQGGQAHRHARRAPDARERNRQISKMLATETAKILEAREDFDPGAFAQYARSAPTGPRQPSARPLMRTTLRAAPVPSSAAAIVAPIAFDALLTGWLSRCA
jgi:hypothetical protein